MARTKIGLGVVCCCHTALIIIASYHFAPAQPTRAGATLVDSYRSEKTKSDGQFRGKILKLDVDRVSLKGVQQRIQEQTGYGMYLPPEVQKLKLSISVHYEGTSIYELMDQVVKGQPLYYEIIKDNISIRPKVRFIMMHVEDFNGACLQAVSIRLNGRLLGVTDSNGCFIFPRPEKFDSLNVTYLGKERKLTSIPDDENFTIRIDPGARKMHAVIVSTALAELKRVGLIDVRKANSDITIAAAGLGLGLFNALAPEVRITPKNGIPGSGVDIVIRGLNRLDGNSAPLFIIDGVPFIYQQMGTIVVGNSGGVGFNPLSFLSEAIIEKVTVVKDADSLAKYGARGANGVILITTARSKGGHYLTASASRGISMPGRNLHLMNSMQYKDMRREAFRNDGIMPDLQNAPDLLGADTARITDWRKVLFNKPAPFTDITISIGGDTGRWHYDLTGTYRDEKEIIGNHPGNYLTTVHGGVDYTGNERLKISAGVTYTVNQNNQYIMDQTAFLTHSPFGPPMFDAERRLVFWDSSGPINNVYAYNQYHYGANNKTLIGYFSMRYVRRHWDLLVNGGYTGIGIGESSLVPASAQDPTIQPRDLRYKAYSAYKGSSYNAQFNYHTTVGKFNFSGCLGGDYYLQNSRRQAPADTTSTANLGDLPGKIVVDYRNAGAFLSFQAAYKRRVFLDLTDRIDLSSRMPSGDAGVHSRAAGFNWIFYRHAAADKDKFELLTAGKLHLSHGITGSDAVDDYAAMPVWSSIPGASPAQMAGAIYPSSPANPSLTWAYIKRSSAGTTLDLFNQQATLGLTFYRQKADNLAVPYQLPMTTGFSTELRSSASSILNWGWEVSLEKQALEVNKLRWVSKMVLTFPRNKLASLEKIEGSQYANNLIVGQPLGYMHLYKYTGVDPLTGLYTFKNGKDAVGGPSIRMYGSWNNYIQFKNWEVNVLLEAVAQTGIDYQRELFNNNPPGIYDPTLFNNQTTKVLDRWQKPGDRARYQRFTTLPGSDAAQLVSMFTSSTGILENASFLRVRALTLSYDLGDWLKKMNMGGKIYLQGQNIFTLTPYADVDPALQSALVYPLVKSYSMGLILNVK